MKKIESIIKFIKSILADKIKLTLLLLVVVVILAITSVLMSPNGEQNSINRTFANIINPFSDSPADEETTPRQPEDAISNPILQLFYNQSGDLDSELQRVKQLDRDISLPQIRWDVQLD